MPSDNIWNSFATVEFVLRTIYLKHAFWWYLKRFGTAEEKIKTMSLKHAFWRYLKRFGTAKKIWEQCVYV